MKEALTKPKKAKKLSKKDLWAAAMAAEAEMPQAEKDRLDALSYGGRTWEEKEAYYGSDFSVKTQWAEKHGAR